MTGLLERPTAPEVIPGVRMRAAGAGDLCAVRAFLGGLSLDSAYRRFFTGIGTPPSEGFARRLLDAEPGRRTVVLATAGTEVVGVADTTITGPTVELGVVVADGWQRRGLGWPLCVAALTPALEAGVPLLRAHVLPDNARVGRMLRRRWPTCSPAYDDGTLTWNLPLTREHVHT